MVYKIPEKYLLFFQNKARITNPRQQGGIANPRQQRTINQ
jgi:hypothetical protein